MTIGRNCAKWLLVLVLLLSGGDFVVRGLIHRADGINDFQDPYIGSLLWRQQHNPYDLATVRQTWRQVSGLPAFNEVKTIYPPSTYLLLSPLSLLAWSSATVVWTLIQILSVVAIGWMIWQNEFRPRGISPLAVFALVLAYAPFHTGVKSANCSQLCIALALASYYLYKRYPWMAGLLLGVSISLKPQIALWFLFFFLAIRAWRSLAATILTGTAILAISLAPFVHELPQLRMDYQANFRRGFENGASGDYTAFKPNRLSIVNLQPAIYQASGSKSVANVLATACFLLLLCLWAWRSLQSPQPSRFLLLSTLIAISLLPLYRRTNDLAILLLPLTWAVLNIEGTMRRYAAWVGGMAALFYLPIASALSHLEDHLPETLIHSFLWRVFAAQSVSWIVLGTAVALVVSLYRSEAGQPILTVRSAGSTL